MANQNQAAPAGGGFLRILGIIYLVKIIRRRRRRRRQAAEERESQAGRA